MKPFYMMILFYSSIKENLALVKKAQEIIKPMSNNDYRVLGFGEHMCAIGFTSDQPVAAINADLGAIQGEKLHALVIEVAQILGGAMYPDAWQWIYRHTPRK